MSKKEKREERLVHGDDLLEAAGVDLDAPDDELLPSLMSARGKSPDADLSIADLLGSIATEKAARHLVEWEKSTPADKDLQRVIRRSLFRLAQRGIASAVREKQVEERTRVVDPVEPTGYLSPLDGGGYRLAWLSRPRLEGGLVVLSSLLSDRSGMRQIHSYHANRNQMKEILADAAEKSAPLAPAPHRYVDWLMWEAYRRGVPRDDQGGGYPLLRADFYTQAPAPVVCPVHSMIEPIPADEESALLDQSAELFNEREFFGWALPEEMVKLHQARFRDAQDSTLVLSKEAVTERLTSVIDRAFEEIFESDARALYADRMQEMSLWFLLSSREGAKSSPARRCYAVHRALAEPGRRLKEVSFLRALVFRSFLHLMPRDTGQEKPPGEPSPDPSSLIVRPD